MKFRYNIDKNALLLEQRGIGFEEIITAITNGNLITTTEHPNQKKYPGQKIMHIRCLDQVYLVPYVAEEGDTIFLKTVFPSRKAKKLYLKEAKPR